LIVFRQTERHKQKRSIEMAPWTKQLVQEHAQVAAAVELYTIPFYTTVMTSIRDTQSEAYKIIRGVVIEEMMHLEQAANLCVALDTPPSLDIPKYDIEVPYLKPGRVLRVRMDALNASTLDAMLAIETPEGILGSSDHTPNPNYEPKYPYSSIEEMYTALLHGIKDDVGIDQFSWNSSKQNDHWIQQGYPQIIRSYDDAVNAVKAIKDQGEGIVIGNGANPWNFPIEHTSNQLVNNPPPGVISPPYDPAVLYKEYSHYGRFLKIKNSPLPDVYAGIEYPDHPTNIALQNNFRTILDTLNYIWQTGEMVYPIPVIGVSVNPMWMVALSAMKQTTLLALNCWKAGVIPYWGEAE
jgi:hypothetical protein